MQAINRLRHVPIFQRLSNEHLTYLSARLGERSYPRGATIFRQGSEGDELHLIVSGQVRMTWRASSAPPARRSTAC
jgi:CRP/FNR family transcriptional regulator